MEYIIKKLGLTNKEFEEIMPYSPKSFLEYLSSHSIIRKLKLFVKIRCKLELLQEIFYEKYC